jgi:hypothetical protein
VYSMPRLRSFVCSLTLFALVGAARADVQVTPATVALDGKFARTQLVVSEKTAGAVSERSNDFTGSAKYLSSNPQIVTVSATGLLMAAANGNATITIQAGAASSVVPVKVTGVAVEPTFGFLEHVMPIMSKAGCNAGACHASQYGKGGFKLSVFGFDPDLDYNQIARDSFRRRVSFLNPEESLLLLKPTLGMPHEGGRRLDKGSPDYEILRRWVASGAPRPPSDVKAGVTGISVFPSRRVGPLGFTQQLRVTATYVDGRERDVTPWAKFDSMDEGVLKVSRAGQVSAIGRGQGACMIRFEGQAVISQVVVPYAGTVDLTGWKSNNYIDELAAAKFKEIGIGPSPLCDDATFLRRAYLDVTGTAPTVEQARAFLDSKDADKRARLIDRLLGLTGDPALDVHNNDYAAYWTLKWSDLIRSNSAQIGEQGMWALHNWVKENFRENRPFDKFVRELVTAKGSTFSNGPANYFRIANNPQDLTEATAQLFMGVRLQCAKCHHHPYERISQTDYYSFAAFFSRVGNKPSQEFGIFGQETVIMVRADGEVGHPKTGKILTPTPLHGKPPAEMPADRRQALAKWLTATDNPYFARNVANRYFAYLMGRGLVEPIDDMRATNPPSNPALLDALAQDLVKNNYNVKQLLRTILNSRLYQLESKPTKENATDAHYFTHYTVKRVPAEALLDAIDGVAGVPTKFAKVPLGTKAIELPDAQYNNYFLKTFGKPRREGVCECERVSEPNMAQALHTLNSDVISAKINATDGRVAKLLAAKKTHEEIVEELYLACLSRRPSEAEKTICKKLLADNGDPRAFYEDLVWTLMNTKQFLFVR